MPVFTAHGQWVGLADNPTAIAILIDIRGLVTGGEIAAAPQARTVLKRLPAGSPRAPGAR